MVSLVINKWDCEVVCFISVAALSWWDGAQDLVHQSVYIVQNRLEIGCPRLIL